MNRKDWYARVNQAWPVGELPQLTAVEAIKSARRLFRWAGVPVPVCPIRIVHGPAGGEAWMAGRQTEAISGGDARGWH